MHRQRGCVDQFLVSMFASRCRASLQQIFTGSLKNTLLKIENSPTD